MTIKKVLLELRELKISQDLMRVEEVIKVGSNLKHLLELKNKENKKRNPVHIELEEELEE